MRLDQPARPAPAFLPPSTMPVSDIIVEREREFPRDGADTYGALPDTAIVYDGSFPASKWAKDEVYMIGMNFPPSENVEAAPEAASEAASGAVPDAPTDVAPPDAEHA
jgi:hypothetical protein